MAAVPPAGGVRSLLAKFESNSQNTSTSPPSRGRSPTNANDSPNARPLSKVRASFVPVDRVGRGSPAGFPRVRDGEGSEKDPRSRTMTPVESLNSPSYSSPQRVRGELASLQGTTVAQINERLEALTVSAGSQNARAAFEPQETPLVAAKMENQQKAPSPEANGVKETATTKSAPQDANTDADRSSAVSNAKANPAAKSNAKPSSTKDPKSTSATSRTSATSASKQAGAEEKASSKKTTTRQSMAPNTKSAATPPPGATRTPRSLPASPRVKSPGRPSRNPASSTASTLASVAKSNTPPPTLSRKSSSLKPDPSSRLTAPTASSLRKQPSRQSLPAQSTQERPKSRVSTTGTTRTAADESFLARMMRPTASSASKAHAKVEPKSPPKPTKTVKPARKSGEGVTEKRPVRPSSKASQRDPSVKPKPKAKPESERSSADTPSAVKNEASDKAQSGATEPAPESVASTLETKSEVSQARSGESVASAESTRQSEDHGDGPADVPGDNVTSNGPSIEVTAEKPVAPTEQPQQEAESHGEQPATSPDAPKDETQSAGVPSVEKNDETADEVVASDTNRAEPASTDDDSRPSADKAEAS